VFEIDLEVSTLVLFIAFNTLMHSTDLVPREALWATHGLFRFGVAVIILGYVLAFQVPLSELLLAMKTVGSRDPCP